MMVTNASYTKKKVRVPEKLQIGVEYVTVLANPTTTVREVAKKAVDKLNNLHEV